MTSKQIAAATENARNAVARAAEMRSKSQALCLQAQDVCDRLEATKLRLATYRFSMDLGKPD
jgi:division protein CdvB (Snf7/Vps24/ESCRT-III family)